MQINLLAEENCLDFPKVNFADDKLSLALILSFVFECIENIVEKVTSILINLYMSVQKVYSKVLGIQLFTSHPSI